MLKLAKFYFFIFNINMNLISTTIYKQNIINLQNWVDTTPLPQAIDNVTYDLYESNNPFRKHFDENQIHNKGLRVSANTATTLSAEFFSAFSNPYYISHKIISIPTYYKNVVNTYEKFSDHNKN
jgi:hypothetical protein